jgi:RNA polymerase sigma factor (sigma-70 family)
MENGRIAISRRGCVIERRDLVERARGGDRIAFALLAQQYQEMALGYALAILHDFHLAQDVTQESLFAAYRGLATLQDTGKFSAWLRGIVRFQCGRILRKRYLDLVPLAHAEARMLDLPGPEQHLEIKEGFHRVLTAIYALPELQREVALLFYIKDYSQREIAGFLEVPVTTVNNRLHAARQALRRRLVMNHKSVGHVVEVSGPVIAVQFEPEHTPLILSALAIDEGPQQQGTTLQVMQRSASGLVRCLLREGHGGVAPSMRVFNTGGPLLTPVDPQTLATALPLLSRASQTGGISALGRTDSRPILVETGIKVIDLLCPYPSGGTAGLFGPSGTGHMVVIAEVLRNAGATGGITFFAFVHGEAGARFWYDTPDEVPQPSGTSQVICLPLDNPIDTTSPSVLTATGLLDARTYLSLPLAKSGIWPAVDPLLSTSRIMDPATIGQKHYDVARAARQLLRKTRELQEGVPDGRMPELTAADRILVTRARKLQRFFTQPFVVAEAFTGRPGQAVPLSETLRVCAALLAGAYDDTPEEEFMWRGTIDEPDRPHRSSTFQ